MTDKAAAAQALAVAMATEAGFSTRIDGARVRFLDNGTSAFEVFGFSAYGATPSETSQSSPSKPFAKFIKSMRKAVNGL